MIDVRTSLVATAIATLCFGVVTVRVATAPPPTPRRQASDAERVELARAIAASEYAWSVESVQDFPEDQWSQRDDFHGKEYRRVVELAAEKKVRIEDVLRAIDEDIHLRGARSPSDPDERNARAIPCKPRPFYD